MAAFGLYSHIQSNKRRSVVLIVGLFFLVYVMTYAGALLAEALLGNDAPLDVLLRRAWVHFIYAVPWATLGTLVWIAVAYKFHQSMIDAVTGGREVTRQEEPRLYNLLENLCISRGITMPKLKIIDDDALNAFATGLNEKQYSITVTSGLLKQLNDAEVESVLGHELTHIRNGDVRMLVIAVVIAGVLSFFAELVFRMVFQSGFSWRRSSSSSSRGDSKGGGGIVIAIVIALALIALAWLLSIVIRFALSRKRELLADAGSVELTKNPDAMISALRKIEGRGELPGANSAVMEMCLDNPREGFSNIFDTHPSVETRIHALMEFAGGHDPGPLALPEPTSPEDPQSDEQAEPAAPGDEPASDGPAPATAGGAKPFLPPQAPIQIGTGLPPSAGDPGPWGPHGRS